MKKVSFIVLGAGSRGNAYSKYANLAPDQMEIVGVADPVVARREHFKRAYNIPEENVATDWKELMERPKFADAVIISNQDRMHFEPAMMAIEKGYHLLLEKPMAPSPDECLKIAEAAEKKGVHVIICHVLRYAPFFCKLKELIDEGRIGKVMNINHTEGIGNIHFSHSYTRGNWHIEAESTPMLLAKSCHDVDIIQWLVGKEFKRVQSFGSLSYFTKENKPEGAPKRCIDGCPYADTCVYNSVKLYYDNKKNAWFRNAATLAAKDTIANDEQVEKALRETAYGYCVFDSDNDVLDHQIVNMEFEDGVIATLTVSAFNGGGRKITIMGTEGEMTGDMSSGDISVLTFKDKKREVVKSYDKNIEEGILGGHGGGDIRTIQALVELLGAGTSSVSYCTARVSAKNHVAAYAAEEARKTGTVVDVQEYMKRFL
ncbi:MAG: Gfo/Idh/MocA family oxidoreductase [Ruminococcaceae bacterium]|nr:Gfo/Idh/MocA family oxidoreductase [Oscillospiraceae bacterium]